MRDIKKITVVALSLIICMMVSAQPAISIGGSVYGGGNHGNTGGNTAVNVYGGSIHQVFGGARQADITGGALVNIDGENASSYIVIDKVYGGNDISGNIGSPSAVSAEAAVPAVLTQASDNGVNNTWNTYVRISTKTQTTTTGEGDDAVTTVEPADDAKPVFMGQLYGGGNGDYTYSAKKANGLYDVTIGDTTLVDVNKPEVAKAYLEVLGGTVAYGYGGGNNVTVTEKTVINFDNLSEVVTSVKDAGGNELLTTTRLHDDMGINLAYSAPSLSEYQFDRFFGGNNKADMDILPTWNLKNGAIRNLYSGGNRGNMTSPYGLLLEIPATSNIKVDEVYGGCRMADVKPTVNGEYKPVANLPGYNFPPELSARVLVKGGDINHVYGGNDITGRVYGGSAVGIYTSVRGDVYGGGNGSYPYTDNVKLQNTLEYGDLYYEPGANSAEALNNFRPNAEQVSIRLAGDDALHPTIIGGSVYCGGNSASLKTNKSKPMVELKIGSYVIAENVFLGNNGENIIKYNAKDKDEEGHDAPGTPEGVLYTMQRTDIPELEGTRFSSIDLTQSANFEAYMQGVAMPLLPNVVFDDEAKGDPETYIPYTALIGSFFCGGNVGSMSAPGTIDLNDVNTVRIYNKFVAGCNDAYVPAHTDFNAAYNGGFTVESHPKINVNLNGLKLCPLKLERDGEGKPTGLAWNLDNTTYSTKRYVGANIYGGCYNSGHINGDVVININESTVNKQKLFEDAKFNIFGEDTDVQLDNADVSFDEQREEIFITSLGIFGAGYGLDSEIWGSTTLNFNNGYNFLVFGGGEKGAVGKKEEGVYTYNPDYSTYVNLKGTNAGTADGTDIPAAEYIYAGGFEGLVAGDTYMNLGNGRVNASFGGACNADILGHAETIIGKGGYPYVVEDVYGANDLGGRIRGEADFKSKVREGARGMMHNAGAQATASVYVEYLQGRVRNIFGGCYGKYEYSAITTPTPIAPYKGTINVDVDGYVRQVLAPYIPNAFVYVHPEQNVNNSVAGIFGAGEGDTNYQEDENGILQPKGSDPIGDMLQDRSYVLVDIPEGYLNLKSTDIYGAGSYNGVGMWYDKTKSYDVAKADSATAIIDLICGEIGSAHGGGYEEGLTRRTVVNVPEGSIVKADKIFGGAEGTSVHKVCDVYESHVNYNSETATAGTLYGGNDAFRQTLYAHVDVTTPVWSDRAKGYKATVYGAGYGLDTWANYTEVNLKPNANPEKDGAIVYEVYGGGEMGRVANVATAARVADVSGSSLLDLPNGYGDGDHHATGLADAMAKVRLDGLKHNTNVLIHKGATVENYAYGGGRGYDDENFGDGDVNGTTYIALMGGTVKKDIYAAGTIGAVLDEFGNLTDYRDEPFVADATAYIAGGSTRNVYGGGWKGSVGKHKKKVGDVWVDAAISDIPDGTTIVDIEGTTHVYVGIRNDQSDANKLAAVKAVLGESATYGFYAGDPTVQRNVYGGGEGGAVFGTTNVQLNNGHIGYVYEDDTYKEKLDDETWTDHVGKDRLLGSGNIFGGGYIDNSSVDSTNVKMWGGYVRNSLFGGGEIAAIGRGDVTVSGYNNSVRTLRGKYLLGKTNVEMFNGHVKRDVFAGGKGYDNLGRVGTLYTDGYVFGKTEAHIHGGEVGTAENYAEGYGNVFGGGDLGYVYGVGTADTEGERPSPNHYYYVDGEGHWTEDCKVVVEPWAQVKADQIVTIGGTTYNEYEYVPTDKLNLLKGKNDITDGAKWAKLDDAGIIIHNAVFAGGNVADGSDKVYANTKTIFGNVTAAVRDVCCRDLITIGTEHTGGLYGDGNLSLVDGYRELHIANYGTDYYNLQQQITMEQYNNLTDRERAYFRLRYTCKTAITAGKDKEGIPFNGYNVGQQIFDDEYNELPDSLQNETYWTQDGVCSIYAGRLLNTLQRAELVGVYGSRMVLQGAEDRVTDVQDKQRYTINRIGELSLKAVNAPTSEVHGNYFGIYSGVNYLGNLTSDVQMNDVRTTDSEDADGGTYHDWKAANKTNKKRNTATCHNQVALASGVFLELVNELTDEEKAGEYADKKKYGYITGVVELDLINAKADAIGGGYVYAKNEHGARHVDYEYDMKTLSDYNDDLRTYKMYSYTETPADTLEQIQTSGNFIHGKKKTIIDDCYPHNLEYNPAGANYSEAHYWYIKGSIYIYDQIINAYTGSPTAYTRETRIPVTITAGAHGVLKLVDIKQNKYAYFDTDGNPLGASDTIKVNNNSVSFGRNDVISYWGWSQLPVSEQRMFVDTTYVKIEENEVTAVALEPGEGTGWHMSNNISHNTGYVLDFKMDTPPAWNTWYSPKTGSGDKINTPTYDDKPEGDKGNYIPGPTYSTSANGVFGQRTYTVGELVPDDVVTKYSDPHTGDQAIVENAYIASEAVSYTYNHTPKSVSAGTPIPYSEYDAIADAAVKAKFSAARMCISTLRLNEQTYIVYGDLLSEADITTLTTAFPSQATAIEAALTPAHVCSKKGLYGGTSYTAGTRYDAIKGWASLTSADRAQNKFSFNYDGLDVLIDPKYSGDMSKYHNPYNQTQKVEYVAIYNSDTPSVSEELGRTIHKGDTLSRTDYETLLNEKYHYTAVVVSTTESTGDDYYIAKKDFARGNVAYAQGQVIPAGTYRNLSTEERAELIEVIKFTNVTSDPVTYYYCREDYTGQTPVTNRNDNGTVDTGDHGSGTTVTAGWVIDSTDFGYLQNHQLNYLIKGEEPTESSTLYVSRESNIEDLSKEKIISVMYQYTYNESGDDGNDANLVNEMHIVNVHILFESGAPIIETLLPPATVLPGTTVGMNQPKVTPGAYELIGGGWEIYSNESDANLHRNGAEYVNNNTPMYWYQDGYYVSYYAKSYLGKTYSNPVQFSVANYHDLKTVLEADHHYYIDHIDARKKRNPKVYINDYTADGKNGLDLLSDLYKLTLGESVTGYEPFNTPNNIRGAGNLDIIFRTNIRHDARWTSIGDETHCFGGNIHGDGHYVSALDHSLFGKLCGHVYNLGVMGTFTGGGIADVADNSGSAENCWIKTSGTPAANTKAVIGSYSSIDQVKNCYYPGNEAFDTTAPAAAMTASKTDFYYGDVAYRLNRQYLLSRYNHNKPALEAVATDTAYIVERYGNPDFLYAEGTIPEEVNTDRELKTPSGDPAKDPTTGEQLYVPLYPYDYLFFGQALNYGHVEGLTHQDVPSPIVKESDVVETGDTGNRVYRAPAYFRNSDMSKVYFNPYAVFAKTNAAESEVIHQGLTAVDFTGYDDAFVGSTGAAKSYGNGTVDGEFFPPLLDVDEVSHISNYGLTKNLLVYTEEAETGESASVAGKTGRAVQLSLTEPEFATADIYGSVAAKDEAFVNGHWVYRDAGATTYGAANDHLLIDKNDFWAPISYTFDGSSRMWYQRTPDTFAGLNTGWESVVLPFTVLTVSTHQKGELTHFYGNDNDGKIGHEYWLRKYTAIATGDEANTMKATFTRPAKGEGEGAYDMVYENTFLWDELHSAISDGQNTYYSVSHTYDDYPLQQQATPYIIGFPGKAFYEFDLSGEWTAPRCPLGFERQTVTFASHTGVTIRKSDVDMNDEEIIKTYGNYTFTPSYLNEEIAAGTQNYVMAADGSKYVKVPATGDATPILPFRAYFAKTGNSGDAISILFTDAEGMPEVAPEENPEPEITPQGEVKRGITFTPGVGTITAKSTLDEPRVILVYGVSGALVKAFDVKPNSTVTIHVPSGLVYAIRTVSGDYSSKLLVR